MGRKNKFKLPQIIPETWVIQNIKILFILWIINNSFLVLYRLTIKQYGHKVFLMQVQYFECTFSWKENKIYTIPKCLI